MTSTTLNLNAQRANRWASGSTAEYSSGNMRAGQDFGTTGAVFQFYLPVDFAGCTINSATLNLKAYGVETNGKCKANIAVIDNATVLASQSLTAAPLVGTPKTIKTTNYTTDAADYTAASGGTSLAVDVAANMIAAQTAGRLSGTYIQFGFQQDSLQNQMGSILRVDLDGSGDASPPTLTIDYTPASTGIAAKRGLVGKGRINAGLIR